MNDNPINTERELWSTGRGRARCPQRAGRRSENRQRWLARRTWRSEDTAPYLWPLRAFLVLIAMLPAISFAQERLKTMPGYERYQKMSREVTNAVKYGSLSVTWKDGGGAYEC